MHKNLQCIVNKVFWQDWRRCHSDIRVLGGVESNIKGTAIAWRLKVVLCAQCVRNVRFNSHQAVIYVQCRRILDRINFAMERVAEEKKGRDERGRIQKIFQGGNLCACALCIMFEIEKAKKMKIIVETKKKTIYGIEFRFQTWNICK